MATSSLGFENFFSTTLNGAISDTDLTINLNSVPTPSEGFLVIEPDNASKREVVYYTSKGASSVTAPSGAGNGRGYDGTTATSHSDGATVIMAPVAAMFEALQDLSAVADGQVSTAKIADDAVTDAKRPRLGGAKLFKTASQLVPTGEVTQITFGTGDVEYDPDSWFDDANDNLVVPDTGIYIVQAAASASSLADGDRFQVMPSISSISTYQSRQALTMGGAVSPTLNTFWIGLLSASDTVGVEVYHTYGSDRNMQNILLTVTKLSD